MRDQFALRPFGRLSIRNFLLFFATIIVAAFAYLFTLAPTAHAASEVTWSGANLSYQSNTYERQPAITADSSTGLAVGTKVFTFTPEVPGGTQAKVQFIYFSPDVDPATAEQAHFVTYDFTPPDAYSNPASKKDLSATPQTAEQTNAQTTSCAVEGGLGWVICPLTRTLSVAMDWIFSILSQFLEVSPISTNQESTLFRAWSMMRNFANVAFVIAFLVVIYSQLSNIGLSNYGLKRLLPRLIIAAILVNVSYWICAIGVDLSNISGHSVQGIFNSMRDNLVGAEGNNFDVVNWKSLGDALLSTSVGGAAAGVGIYALVAGAGGAIYMLLPILLGVLLAAMVALIVMAARQALITILIIVAPLAFVAFLLPNTEKYFKKWHELFTTMLLVFPAFAVVFSGAQLAGDIIIQNADSIVTVILGMAVKVAPIAITPLLMKVSGSLLGKVAGVVNNPRKGLLDRTRGMVQERADQRKSRVLAGDKTGLFGIQAGARRIDYKKREREGMKKAHDSRADANFAKSKAFERIHHYDANSNLIKEAGEANAARHTAIAQATNATDQGIDLNARVAKVQLDASKAVVEANWDEFKAGNASSMVKPEGLAVDALANYAHTRHADAQSALAATIETAVETRRAASAGAVKNDRITEAYINNEALQVRAGGVAGKLGADAALADAIKGKRKSHNEAVDDASELLKHFNPNGPARQSLAMGLADIDVKDSAGNIIQRFSKDSKFVREAVIEAQLAGEGSYANIQEIISQSGSDSLKEFATTIGSAIPKYKLTEKAAFLGGKTIDEVKQGDIKNLGDLNKSILRTISDGKLKTEQLATMDAVAVEQVLKVARDNYATAPPKVQSEIRRLGSLADEALTNTSIRGRVASNVEIHLKDFRREWPPPPTPPTP